MFLMKTVKAHDGPVFTVHALEKVPQGKGSFTDQWELFLNILKISEFLSHSLFSCIYGSGQYGQKFICDGHPDCSSSYKQQQL